MGIFAQLESDVRSYCRAYPTVFTTAEGATLTNTEGKQYLDFLSGAGTLNYGHNNPLFKKHLLAYIERGGVVHSLDTHTAAKRDFLNAFDDCILQPRELDYKLQFPGPTGTNAVEAAMKIARNVTGRQNIIAFSNGFHGVTLGSVAATANSYFRDAAGMQPSGTTFLPYDGYLGKGVDTTEYLDKVLTDTSSGVDHPAAVIVETVQGEGGVNIASFDWLRRLERVCRKHGVLIIVDDIQMGCGRTGPFFSFEPAGIKPDIITLSKSLSGYGLPFSLVLIKPEYDQWSPGQHNGTFRGHNLAFVTAKAALDYYWQDDLLTKSVERLGRRLLSGLRHAFEPYDDQVTIRARGLVAAIEFSSGELAEELVAACFERGLIIENCGTDGRVIKTLTPLTITEDELDRGVAIIAEAARAVFTPTLVPVGA